MSTVKTVLSSTKRKLVVSIATVAPWMEEKRPVVECSETFFPVVLWFGLKATNIINPSAIFLLSLPPPTIAVSTAVKKEDAQIWAVFKIKSPSLVRDWLLFKLANMILITKYIKMNFCCLKKKSRRRWRCRAR